jgi:DnaJ-class molecular chaperone
MSKYLRPETLFGTKFEGYLNTAKKAHRPARAATKKDCWCCEGSGTFNGGPCDICEGSGKL